MYYTCVLEPIYIYIQLLNVELSIEYPTKKRYTHGLKWISGLMLQKHLQIGQSKHLRGPHVNVQKECVSPHLNHEGIYS